MAGLELPAVQSPPTGDFGLLEVTREGYPQGFLYPYQASAREDFGAEPTNPGGGRGIADHVSPAVVPNQPAIDAAQKAAPPQDISLEEKASRAEKVVLGQTADVYDRTGLLLDKELKEIEVRERNAKTDIERQKLAELKAEITAQKTKIEAKTNSVGKIINIKTGSDISPIENGGKDRLSKFYFLKEVSLNDEKQVISAATKRGLIDPELLKGEVTRNKIDAEQHEAAKQRLGIRVNSASKKVPSGSPAPKSPVPSGDENAQMLPTGSPHKFRGEAQTRLARIKVGAIARNPVTRGVIGVGVTVATDLATKGKVDKKTAVRATVSAAPGILGGVAHAAKKGAELLRDVAPQVAGALGQAAPAIKAASEFTGKAAPYVQAGVTAAPGVWKAGEEIIDGKVGDGVTTLTKTGVTTSAVVAGGWGGAKVGMLIMTPVAAKVCTPVAAATTPLGGAICGAVLVGGVGGMGGGFGGAYIAGRVANKVNDGVDWVSNKVRNLF